MCPPSHTRRSLLRAGGTVTAVAAAGGLAGCLDSLGDAGPAGAPSERLNSVPAAADAVFTVDVNTVMADDAVRTAYNAWLEARAESGAYDGPTDLSETLDDFEEREGIDVRDLSTMTLFYAFEVEEGQPQGMRTGIIIEGSWSESEALSTVDSEHAEYSETSYGEYTIHEPEEFGQSLGVIEEGTYVIGDRTLLEETLDVDSGEGESMSGPVADAYHDARTGPIRFATSFHEGWIPEETSGPDGTVDLSPLAAVETVAGGVYRDGSTRGVAVDLNAPDAGTAQELDDVMQALLTIASTETELTPTYVSEFLADVDVSRDGATVELTVERTVDELEEIATQLGGQSAGAGTGGREGPDAPAVSLDWAYDGEAGTLEITHAAGDTLDADAIRIEGEGFADAEGADMTEPGPWAGTTRDGDIVAGESVVVGVSPDYTIGVVWEEGDTSILLDFQEGPARQSPTPE